MNFKGANQCSSGTNFFQGVCLDCSPYFKLDDSNNLKPKSDYGEFRRKCMERGSRDSLSVEESVESEEEHFNVLDIAPYSEYNLMSTNIWNDEGYGVLMESMTQAEKLVCTPVHMQTHIVRCRSNGVAFSKFGSICYPLKKIYQAKSLPWYEFEELPFVVMMFLDKLGNVREATVDMDKIRRVR